MGARDRMNPAILNPSTKIDQSEKRRKRCPVELFGGQHSWFLSERLTMIEKFGLHILLLTELFHIIICPT